MSQNTNIVTCSPFTALNVDTFTLSNFDSTLVASNFVLLVDEQSKKLIIDPNYTEEPDDNKNDGDSKNDISGIFNNKFSSLLMIGTGLLL